MNMELVKAQRLKHIGIGNAKLVRLLNLILARRI
jgi:hypothetical protein